MSENSPRPPGKEEPKLTPAQLKALRIGCVFAWLLLLSPPAVWLALVAICGPNIGSRPASIGESGIVLTPGSEANDDN